MEQENSLLDIENEINFEPATTGQRFANYLIDMIIFYIVLIAVFAAIFYNRIAQNDYENDKSAVTGNGFADYVLIYFVYIVLNTLFEGASKGRSIGKWITGTKATKDDGGNISWRDAFLRSLSRCVPFEPFSAFGGYPWHDKWTNTKVVKIRK